MEHGITFKSKIGLPLETMAAQLELDKITSNVIECGGFVPVMVLILCNKYRRTQEVIEFLKECEDAIGLSYNNLSLDRAEELFEKFRILCGEEIDNEIAEE